MLSALSCDETTDITDEIERVRSEMIELGEHFGLLHPDVQKCSKQLDLLLNRFYTQYFRMSGQ